MSPSIWEKKMANDLDLYSVAIGADAVEFVYAVKWNKRHGGVKTERIMVPRHVIEPQVQDLIDSAMEAINAAEEYNGPDEFTAMPDKVAQVLAEMTGMPADQVIQTLMDKLEDE
jgi:hypothetical protein